jgi:hypothetical protein
MITKTPFFVPLEIVDQAKKSTPQLDFRLSINQPTGRFFYDPWEIKEEFKNTVWETILSVLPSPLGEARIIELKHGTCYMSHCDIDERYHLNLEGQYSFLIDIDSQKMYPTVADGNWYIMDTGIRHVAANFGSINRFQLVVRKLLNEPKLVNPVSVEIKPVCANPRFEFDDVISPWLHKMNKELLLNQFHVSDEGVSFNLEKTHLSELDLFSVEKFKIIKK